MISVLCPSRNRPEIIARMMRSAFDTAQEKIEICVYLDEVGEPNSLEAIRKRWYDYIVRGEIKISQAETRLVFSALWNEAYKLATGNILMLANDDIVFRTQGWDMMVEQEFALCPDKILMVYGNDLGHGERFGPHPFISRKWVDLVGYFSPPWFCSDCNDQWLNDVSEALHRRKFIPAIIEHCHILWNKAEMDSTYRERLDREAKERPLDLYATPEMKKRRKRDIELLRAAMNPNWRFR